MKIVQQYHFIYWEY